MNDVEARLSWDAWIRKPFPRGWASVSVNPVNDWPLAYLDYECAADLARYFGDHGFKQGDLDGEHRRQLAEMVPDIELAILATEGAARAYFEALGVLARYVLDATSGP